MLIGTLFISACGGTDYNCCSDGDGACGDGGGHCLADSHCQGDLSGCGWGNCQQSTAPPSGRCCMAGRESFMNILKNDILIIDNIESFLTIIYRYF